MRILLQLFLQLPVSPNFLATCSVVYSSVWSRPGPFDGLTAKYDILDGQADGLAAMA